MNVKNTLTATVSERDSSTSRWMPIESWRRRQCRCHTRLNIVRRVEGRTWTSDRASRASVASDVTIRCERSHRECSSVDHWCSHTDTNFTTDKLVHRGSEPLLCVTTIQQNRGYWFRGTGFQVCISYERNIACNHQIFSDIRLAPDTSCT
jgi:hypothetical protein